MVRFLSISLIIVLLCQPLSAQELVQNVETNIPIAGKLSYNIQKYTGFNFLVHFLATKSIKGFIEIKTNAKDSIVDLKIYSGWDLIKKKAKSLYVNAEKLFIKDIPIEYFNFVVDGPIYFKKNSLGKNQTAIPIDLIANIKVDLSNINEIINSLPKWKKVLGELDLPIPPFGYTKVSITDLEIKISEAGLVQIKSYVRSLLDPQSEPIKMSLSGALQLTEEKIILSDLKCELEDIFTSDSEIGKSFSLFLEELINPVFDFHKIERNGLTIDNVDLRFALNKLDIAVKGRWLPEENENN